MSFLYLVCIAVLYLAFVLILFLMKHFKNEVLTNAIFCSLIVFSYLGVVLIAYYQNGVDDWNFQNTLPTANVSPFMFAACPLFFLLPKSIRVYFSTLISLLTVGMILSPTFSCIFFFIRNYSFHFQFFLDYAAHIAMALWGVYLVWSKQASLKKIDCIIGGGIIVFVAFIMMILNTFFDTSFFGLNLSGKHHIYNQVLVSNSFLSAGIYFLGLFAALFAGYFFQKLLSRFDKLG